MSAFLRNTCYFIAALLLHLTPGYSQSYFGKVYEVKNREGKICIYGENISAIPITIILRVDLRHMYSNVNLPANFTILPLDKPLLLATLTPEPNQDYFYRCRPSFRMGIASSQVLDTTYIYGLPYPAGITAALPERAIASSNYPFIYYVSLPDNTPICAVRNGVVAVIKQKNKYPRLINDNLLYVLHDDGSWACYDNMRVDAAVVREGQRVSRGDTLSYFKPTKRLKYFWFSAEYFGEQSLVALPVSFQVGTQVIRPRMGKEKINSW